VSANGACVVCGRTFCRECLIELDGRFYCKSHSIDAINGLKVNSKKGKDLPPPKDWLITLLLCVLLGFLGVHRFYVGKVFTGILYLLSGGIFGIGWLLDVISIASGNFTDSTKQKLS